MPTTPASAAPTCCRKPMSAITVTDRGASLTLHSCAACGRHRWERDGQEVDRSALLDGVRTYLEQPRQPTPRRKRVPAPRAADPRDLLAGFVVHGRAGR